MAPKMLYYLLAVASAITSASAVAIAIPEAAPAPFVIPEDVEVLDLRTDSDKALGKRVNGGVYICKAINFDANQGCVLIVTSWGNPTSLVGTEWNNAISSAGADPGTNCQFFDAFSSGQCTGQGWLPIAYGGINDFRAYPWNNGAGTWNDVTTCLKCWY